MNYILELYCQLFCCLKRGNVRGVFSNAKPIFLLTLLNTNSIILSNHLLWNNKEFECSYTKLFVKWDPSKVTPIWKPFYYLSSEPFYNLCWKKTPPTELLNRPSSRLLKEYLDYAKLDDDLWMLLQDENNRKYLQDCIINHYFAH